MRPYQIKYFKQGMHTIRRDLEKSIPIQADSLIVLLNDILSAKGEMTEQEVHRDNNFEIVGTTTEKFQTADALGHDLAGRIRALVDFVNATMSAGVTIKY